MPAACFRAKNNASAIQTAINDWIAATTFTSIDDTEIVQENSQGGYVVVTIIYTA